jgi:hypothetical protein
MGALFPVAVRAHRNRYSAALSHLCQDVPMPDYLVYVYVEWPR